MTFQPGYRIAVVCTETALEREAFRLLTWLNHRACRYDPGGKDRQRLRRILSRLRGSGFKAFKVSRPLLRQGRKVKN